MSMIDAGPPQRREPPTNDGYVRPPALLSVDAAEDEDVEWTWTHYADGRSVVTGYRIAARRELLVCMVETPR